MNLIVIPFHDWRKIQKEGFRTRDAHFIEEFGTIKSQKTLIVNRPTTRLEIFLRYRKIRFNYDVVYKEKYFTLYKINDNLYMVDSIFPDIIGQLLKKYLWFVEKYGDEGLLKFINKCLNIIDFSECVILSQNIFAYQLLENVSSSLKIFDAWDDFTKFNVYKKVRFKIYEAYNVYAKKCNFWVTNSKENISRFYQKFSPNFISLIKNGVDVKRFSGKSEIPRDIKNIPRPIVGFGGKVSHLIDVPFLNEVLIDNPHLSFVFIGQILDKKVYKKINKTNNFYYLGDKHYDEYPNYVKNFDICIIPYVVEDSKKSGANSIKMYEYLAANKKVIGTSGNGLEEMQEYVFVTNDPKNFSLILNSSQAGIKNEINIDEYSWNLRVRELLKLINSY
ncbi:Glycosyltransferase involved in cell wall bisynthesis [Pustulibacterium marinum]|uniref:Glycosyltransferase involved in cell wall bisynthesis n=1 Tax=Pustulibacterium marinum TaxID=1224947 RepID=A0A1I7ETQ2_9FLAO|nr:hypothetical protein [Pustulibacterium marinum]SFU27300.1 Glycosyltransferase involved in cell wall bisynthesis [Pustulibacterium marinum]